MSFFPLFPNTKRALLCLALFATLGTGCVHQKSSLDGGQTGRSGGTRTSSRTTVQMFTPMQQSGAVRLSQAEALQHVRKMQPRTQEMKSWSDMGFAVSQSLAYAAGRPAGNLAVQKPGLKVTYGELATTLRHMQGLLPRLDKNPGLLASEFHWYRIGPDFGFTGYYEPTLKASRKPSAAYPYPLYRLPPDIRKNVPYHSRNAIDRRGALKGKNLELAWVSSEVDAFFLHIQGSGRLQFPDGSVSHALFAGKNNQAYRPLGRIMRDEGLLAPDNISMQSIKQTLAEHPPRRQAELMDKNPSYIFFREAAKGPLGAMGRPLTPWVSTATDRSVLPHGSLAFVLVPLPDAAGDLTRPFCALTLPQDTGGAIKGHRIDLFCGPSAQAEHTAGYLDTKGAVFVLVKK